MKSYKRIKQIGSGSFGQVYLCEHVTTKMLQVIKVLKTASITKKEADQIQNEIDLMKKLIHPNIVKYKDSVQEKQSILIFMQYCKSGDVSQKIELLKQKRNSFIEEDKVLLIFVQICLALEYLHSRKILHRDLKCGNIFLGGENGRRIVLGDFGIAKLLSATRDFAQTVSKISYLINIFFGKITFLVYRYTILYEP